MKSITSSLALTVSIIMLACLPSLVSARTSFHIGIGYGYPHFNYAYRPHSRWYSGHYSRIDRFRYRRPFAYAARHHHWPRYRRSTHLGFLIDCWHPSVIVEKPVIVERKKVITRKKVVVEPKYDDETLKLFKRLRIKKRELLKKLKLGDHEARKKVISELSGFSFDDKVKKALEDILLSEPDPELRKEAAKSFAKVKNKGSLLVLEKVRVEDSNKEVREEADKAIKIISEH